MPVGTFASAVHIAVVAEYVKYRTFDGVDDWLQMAIAESVSDGFRGFSWAAIMRRNAQGSFMGVMGTLTSGNTQRCTIYHQDTTQRLNWYPASTGSESSVMTFTTADGWMMLGCNKVFTAGNARWHLGAVGSGSATHENGGSGTSDPTAPGSGGKWEVGRVAPFGQFNSMDVALMAYWPGQLTDANFASLTVSMAEWTALSPRHLWRFDQTPVNDLVGAAHQSAINGTTVSSSDSPLPYTPP